MEAAGLVAADFDFVLALAPLMSAAPVALAVVAWAAAVRLSR